MVEDKKIIGGIFSLFIGFWILIQTSDNTKFFGLLPLALGLYLILSELK